MINYDVPIAHVALDTKCLFRILLERSSLLLCALTKRLKP
jgi:hypothetical protein